MEGDPLRRQPHFRRPVLQLDEALDVDRGAVILDQRIETDFRGFQHVDAGEA